MFSVSIYVILLKDTILYSSEAYHGIRELWTTYPYHFISYIFMVQLFDINCRMLVQIVEYS